MARNALFPETILDAAEAIAVDGDEEDDTAFEKDESLDKLLAELTNWTSDSNDTAFKTTPFSAIESPSYSDVFTDELQSWRKQNMQTPYNEWSEERKKEFTVCCWTARFCFLSMSFLSDTSPSPSLRHGYNRMCVLSSQIHILVQST